VEWSKTTQHYWQEEEQITTWKGIVEYIPPKFIYKNKIDNDYYIAGTSGFEVIGNIYENPELLGLELIDTIDDLNKIRIWENKPCILTSSFFSLLKNYNVEEP